MYSRRKDETRLENKTEQRKRKTKRKLVNEPLKDNPLQEREETRKRARKVDEICWGGDRKAYPSCHLEKGKKEWWWGSPFL